MNPETKKVTIEEVIKEINKTLDDNKNKDITIEQLENDLKHAKMLLEQGKKAIKETQDYIRPYMETLRIVTEMKKVLETGINEIERNIENAKNAKNEN